MGSAATTAAAVLSLQSWGCRCRCGTVGGWAWGCSQGLLGRRTGGNEGRHQKQRNAAEDVGSSAQLAQRQAAWPCCPRVLAARAQSNQILPAGPAALQVGDITGLYLVDDEGTLQTVEVQVGQGYILGESRDILGAILGAGAGFALSSFTVIPCSQSQCRAPANPWIPGPAFPSPQHSLLLPVQAMFVNGKPDKIQVCAALRYAPAHALLLPLRVALLPLRRPPVW